MFVRLVHSGTCNFALSSVILFIIQTEHFSSSSFRSLFVFWALLKLFVVSLYSIAMTLIFFFLVLGKFFLGKVLKILIEFKNNLTLRSIEAFKFDCVVPAFHWIHAWDHRCPIPNLFRGRKCLLWWISICELFIYKWSRLCWWIIMCIHDAITRHNTLTLVFEEHHTSCKVFSGNLMAAICSIIAK